MPSPKRKVIVLPDSCGLIGFEFCMSGELESSLKATEVVFDLSQLHWIGLLQVSLLFGWVQRLLNKKIAVTLSFPSVATAVPAYSFLKSTGFLRAVESIGANLTGDQNWSRHGALAVFRRFSTTEELRSYEASLENPENRKHLMGGGDDIELVSTGDFRDILLHELVENAFLHGEGNSVRFGLVEMPGTGPKEARKQFLSTFSGKKYVEFVVSDDGRGLVTTLQDAVDKEWRPSELEHSSKLSAGALVCAFALEFSSTSNVEKRKERLREIVTQADDFHEVVPTGLFHVSSLVKHYGGQLIFRTARRCVSFDFSESAAGVITENPLGKQGANVPGTHVLIRIPRDSRGYVHATDLALPTEFPAVSGTVKTIILEQLWNSAAHQPDAFIFSVEKGIDELLQGDKETKPGTLIVLADGCSADTKTIALLLLWIGTIPHRGWAIRVLGLGEELFQSAREQVNRLSATGNGESKTSRFLNLQPYVIVNWECNAQLEFVQRGRLSAPGDELVAQYERTLHQIVDELIESAPIRHVEKQNRYYLIEGKYYTQRFFEIRRLITPDGGKLGLELSASIIRLWVRRYSIGAIVAIAEPLFDLVGHLQTRLSNVLCVAIGRSPIAVEFQTAQKRLPPGKSLLLLTDVICTADHLTRYFRLSNDVKSVVVGAFVNGQQKRAKYVPFERDDRIEQIPLAAISALPIQPITDLKVTQDTEILIVDPRTHSPTPRDDVRPVVLDPDAMIEKAVEAGALVHGHVAVEDKHFVDFVLLPQLIDVIAGELEKSWIRMLLSFEEQRINPSDVSVFYLDEERGWEEIVVNFMAMRGVAECRRVTREAIEAPRAAGEASIYGSCIWMIVPVIASGETTRRFLDFATRHKAGRPGKSSERMPPIFMSIVFARMPPRELSFYQNITSYKAASVWTDVLGFLPLPAFQQRECPICIARATVSGNFAQADEWLEIGRAVARAEAELEPTVLNAKAVISKHPSGLDQLRQGKLARMRALYQYGEKDVLERKKLTEMLDAEGGIEQFVEMVGANFDPVVFSTESVTKAIYTRYEKVRTVTEDILSAETTGDFSLAFLLGAHVLFPELFEALLPRLVRNAANSSMASLIDRLVFVALLDPERYGPQLATGVIQYGPTASKSSQLRPLCEEISTYPHWFGKDRGQAIAALEDMLWLVRRSTVWGTGIENLRNQIELGNSGRPLLHKEWRHFEIAAANRILRDLATLKNRDLGKGLWTSVIAEGGDPDEAVAQLNKHIASFGCSISETADLSLLHLELDLLDQAGRRLATIFEQLYTNVVDAVAAIRKYERGNRWSSVTQGRLEIKDAVADDQPGVLFSSNDLINSLCAALENAEAFLVNSKVAGRFWIEFRFAGFDQTKEHSILEIHDNIPYDRPPVPKGGLKQVNEHCQVYGANFQTRNGDGNGDHCHMKVVFRTDRSRRDKT